MSSSTRPGRTPHSTACPNTEERQLPCPLSGRFSTVITACPGTGLAASAGTAAPRPPGLRRHSPLCSGNISGPPSRTNHPSGCTFWNGCCCCGGRGEQGPQNVLLRALRMQGRGRAVEDVGDPAPAPEPPREVTLSLPPRDPGPQRRVRPRSEF